MIFNLFTKFDQLPTCCHAGQCLTWGTAKIAALRGFSIATCHRIAITTVTFLPPPYFLSCSWSKFSRLHHFCRWKSLQCYKHVGLSSLRVALDTRHHHAFSSSSSFLFYCGWHSTYLVHYRFLLLRSVPLFTYQHKHTYMLFSCFIGAFHRHNYFYTAQTIL